MASAGTPGSAGTRTAAIAVAALCLLASCERHRILDAGPMLQDVSTNSLRVLWWQSRANSGALILRETGGQLRRIQAQRDGSRFEALLDGLQPATTYNYWVACEAGKHGNTQVPGRLRTAPQAGKPFSFLVFGDSGSGKATQYRLAEVMNRHPVALILHTGDLVYPKGEIHDYPSKFFLPYRALLAFVPMYPVLGNHDLGTDNGNPLLDTFSLPANGPPSVQAERCYWFDYGNARFVAVDSTLETQTLASAVAPWLRQTLQTAPGRWRFVFFHHAPWAGGSRPPNVKIRDTLVPAIEAGGADIVFCGHNHLYERTHPMLAGEVSPSTGVLYITSAAGGKSRHKEKHANEAHIAAFNDSHYSFTRVSINGPRLELMQISDDDRILDRVVLEHDYENDAFE